MSKYSSDRRGVLTLPFLGLVLAAIGIGALAQSALFSTSRRLLSSLHVDETAVLAARSAFEEAANVLETACPPVPFPGPDDMDNPRNLRTMLPIPAAVSAGATAQAFRAAGVSIGAVAVESSDWQLVALDVDRDNRRALVSEGGMLTMRVTVTVRARPGGPALAPYHFSTRRLMGCMPDPSRKRGRVVVEAGDIGFGHDR